MRGLTGSRDKSESQKTGRIAPAITLLFRVLARAELRRYRLLMLVALVLTIAAKLLSVISPVFLGDAINALQAHSGQVAITSMALMLLAWSGARFLAVAFPQMRNAMFGQVSQAASRMVAVDAFSHANSLSLQFHLTRRAGALQRVIERGAQAIPFLLRFLVFNIVPTIVELVLAAGVLAIRYGAWFSLIAVVTVATYAAFTVLITDWRVKQRRAMNVADGEVRGRMVDSLANFETVKSFATEDRESARYSEALSDYNRLYVQVIRSLSLLNAGQEFIMGAGLFAAALTAVMLHGQGHLQIGDISAVILILMNIYRPLNILGFAWREIKQGAVDLENMQELMESAPEVADIPQAPDLQVDKGAVRFSSVDFVHQGRQQGLNSISFTAAPGEKIGIVGPSGAGKSTIVKLLFRFYDPVHGHVEIDGQDIAQVTQKSLREALGLVPQDVVLFNDTLHFNITYARPEATEAEVRDALKRAHLTEFVDSLPAGLQTRVGERGLKLSGGEKQRVGIARAILKDPAILVLDEATSSLDSSTEREVQAALDEAAEGRTSLVIAHRLSTIRDADIILVIADGKLVEQGTHGELMAQNGIYARMWRHQAETSLD